MIFRFALVLFLFGLGFCPLQGETVLWAATTKNYEALTPRLAQNSTNRRPARNTKSKKVRRKSSKANKSGRKASPSGKSKAKSSQNASGSSSLQTRGDQLYKFYMEMMRKYELDDYIVPKEEIWTPLTLILTGFFSLILGIYFWTQRRVPLPADIEIDDDDSAEIRNMIGDTGGGSAVDALMRHARTPSSHGNGERPPSGRGARPSAQAEPPPTQSIHPISRTPSAPISQAPVSHNPVAQTPVAQTPVAHTPVAPTTPEPHNSPPAQGEKPHAATVIPPAPPEVESKEGPPEESPPPETFGREPRASGVRRTPPPPVAKPAAPPPVVKSEIPEAPKKVAEPVLEAADAGTTGPQVTPVPEVSPTPNPPEVPEANEESKPMAPIEVAAEPISAAVSKASQDMPGTTQGPISHEEMRPDTEPTLDLFASDLGDTGLGELESSEDMPLASSQSEVELSELPLDSELESTLEPESGVSALGGEEATESGSQPNDEDDHDSDNDEIVLEPITLEAISLSREDISQSIHLYAEITAHFEHWRNSGEDCYELLHENYQLTWSDWKEISQKWKAKFEESSEQASKFQQLKQNFLAKLEPGSA